MQANKLFPSTKMPYLDVTSSDFNSQKGHFPQIKYIAFCLKCTKYYKYVKFLIIVFADICSSEELIVLSASGTAACVDFDVGDRTNGELCF